MPKSSDFSSLPDQAILEKRFAFIDNDILKTNIVIAFRYVTFLVLLDTDELPGVLRYSLYKDIILHTSSVIECCIYYCLDQAVKKGYIGERELNNVEWIDISTKQIYKIDEDNVIVASHRRKKYYSLKENNNFIILNRAAMRANIFDISTFNAAETIRKMRNHIHLASLEDVDDFYQKGDVDDIFEKAKKILTCIEEYI